MVNYFGTQVYLSSAPNATPVYFVSSSVKGARPVRIVPEYPHTPGAEAVRDVGPSGKYLRGAKPVYKVGGIST
jgi:hypothetical protein